MKYVSWSIAVAQLELQFELCDLKDTDRRAGTLRESLANCPSF